MAVETDEDLAIFFDTDDFGVVATITPISGASFTLNGIFDQPHSTRGISQDNGYSNHAQISGQVPVFRCRTLDVASLKMSAMQQATLEVAGKAYKIEDIKPDGKGTTIFRLMR